MIAIHFKTAGEDLKLIKGRRFVLKKSETLFMKTLDQNVLKMGNNSHSIHKMLELDTQVCCPEYLKLYVVPTQVLLKKYKVLPTIFQQEVPFVPNQYTKNLGIGIVALSEIKLPKDLVAAALVVKLSPDAPMLKKIQWFLTRKITYIYDK